MSGSALGAAFEDEIREQPAVWERLARSTTAARLAAELDRDVVLIGSGSSLFVAQLGALALRRRRFNAHALAATEARLDHNAYAGRTVVAISQSGRSSDLLEAIDILAPRRLIALTNTSDSPLAARADLSLDIGAGIERAVPAGKSVSATVAILLWAASIAGGDHRRDGATLSRTADAVRAWLGGGTGVDAVAAAARRIAHCRGVLVLGSDYGLPIALETALKFKEAAYVHAEGFAAGEFRHGSVALVDSGYAVLGILDADAFAIVERPLLEVEATGPLRYTLGSRTVSGVIALGPAVEDPFNTLAWLVTAQLLALFAGRARGIDSDAPRGLTKALVAEHL
jgi:glucosamine--fructose-6-phosphate aminotransferase (isomerizing)